MVICLVRSEEPSSLQGEVRNEVCAEMEIQSLSWKWQVFNYLGYKGGCTMAMQCTNEECFQQGALPSCSRVPKFQLPCFQEWGFPSFTLPQVQDLEKGKVLEPDRFCIP
eukprot:1158532-Pelagomonas_calceolata.AAC.10